jgi:hypothetical protein
MLRWLARILGGAILLLFLTFGLGEGFGSKAISFKEILGFACLGIMILGVLLAYWRTLAGCFFMLAGYIGFTLYDHDYNADNPFIAFPILAIIYLLAWFLDKSAFSGKNR